MARTIDDPRRDLLVKLLTLGLIGSTTLPLPRQPALAMEMLRHRIPEGRSIYRLTGEVYVDSELANLTTIIKPNSVVRTGYKSSVIFAVAGDAFILRENSELRLSSQGNVLIEGLRLLSGKLLSVFGKRPESHSITTSTATIGIRGTGIYVESEPELSYVCTCYGKTQIRSQTDPNQSEDIVTLRHESPRYILDSPRDGKLIIPAPIINHTDAELVMIEELVGRRVPFDYSAGSDGKKFGGGY